MIARQAPHEGADPAALITQPPSRMRNHLPGELDSTVRCWRLDDEQFAALIRSTS